MCSYQQFLDKALGKGVITLKKDEKTLITQIFDNNQEYLELKKNFFRRINRLFGLYSGTSNFSDLKNKIELIARKNNWKGAYAELAAYDILNNCDCLAKSVKMECVINLEESLAKDFGKKDANIDGYVEEFDLYFDVKIMADVVNDFLENVIKHAKETAGCIGSCSVLPEYNLEDDESVYAEKYNDLTNELTSFLKSKKSRADSMVLDGLSYNIKYGSGVNMSENTYSPYEHAYKHGEMLLKRYAYKFLKNKPFYLVMVNFPWYNPLLNCDDNEIFYRSLARRHFCDIMQNSKKMIDLCPKFSGKGTVRDVARKLAGIIFLEDLSIKEQSYNCYVYLNPNADNKNPLAENYINAIVHQAKKGRFDKFFFDNY